MTPEDKLARIETAVGAIAESNRLLTAIVQGKAMGLPGPIGATSPLATPLPPAPWWQSSMAALMVGLLVMGGGASLGGVFRIPQIEDTANRTVLALTELRRAFESDVRSVRDAARDNGLQLTQLQQTINERQEVIRASTVRLREMEVGAASLTLAVERLRAETDLGRRELDGRLAAMAREAEAAWSRQIDKDSNILRSIATNREESATRDRELRETLNGLLRDLPTNGRRTTLGPGDASTELPDLLPARPPLREARTP